MTKPILPSDLRLIAAINSWLGIFAYILLLLVFAFSLFMGFLALLVSWFDGQISSAKDTLILLFWMSTFVLEWLLVILSGFALYARKLRKAIALLLLFLITSGLSLWFGLSILLPSGLNWPVIIYLYLGTTALYLIGRQLFTRPFKADGFPT